LKYPFNWILFRFVCTVLSLVRSCYTDIFSRSRSSTRPGGVGGDCYVCGSTPSRLTITTDATAANDPGAVYSTTKDCSVVATTSSWPDGHRTVTTDWTTSDRQSPSSSSLLPVFGAAKLSNSSRICFRPVVTFHETVYRVLRVITPNVFWLVIPFCIVIPDQLVADRGVAATVHGVVSRPSPPPFELSYSTARRSRRSSGGWTMVLTSLASRWHSLAHQDLTKHSLSNDAVSHRWIWFVKPLV